MTERQLVGWLAPALLVPVLLVSCSRETRQSAEVAVAEQFVTAFYSFNPEPLRALLTNAGDSQQDILFYQGWARGGNYIVVDRMACEQPEAGTVRCSITVQDDLVLALGIDFDVTDTFTLTFDDGAITAVDTSSNDPRLYHDARDWVWEHRVEWVEQPCNGSPESAADPVACVSSMLKGYREYASLNSLTPRAAR